MEQKEIKLGWQDLEKLKQDGRVLEAFVILINWIERNLQFPIYYYHIISKKDESKKKEFLQRFETNKDRESRLSKQDLMNILNKEQSQQEKTKIWVTITRFWGSEEIWEEFKKILRIVGKEFQLKDVDRLIKEISDFRDIRGKVIHRLVEDRVTYEEVEKYYEIGKIINQKIKQLHPKFLT